MESGLTKKTETTQFERLIEALRNEVKCTTTHVQDISIRFGNIVPFPPTDEPKKTETQMDKQDGALTKIWQSVRELESLNRWMVNIIEHANTIV